MTATSGRTSRDAFAYYDPDSSCLRTSQATFHWDSTPSSLTLPPSGSMRSGQLFERATSVPATSAPDCSSLLPTPAASEAGGTPERHLERKNLLDGGNRTKVTELSLFVKLLPTPTSAAGMGGNLGRSGERGDELLLPGLVKTFLPTPTTEPATGNGHARNLGAEVKTLPTPTARDWKDGPPCEAVEENALLGRVVWSIGATTPPPSTATPPSSDDPHPAQRTLEDASTLDSWSGCR